MKKKSAIEDLLKVMAKLRSPTGCPWDREQSHLTLRRHAIEEVYELIDAIEARDDIEMAEELGDLLLQVVFHCQLARERGAFDFEKVTRHLVDKLIRRHPHVFGDVKVSGSEEVLENWEAQKAAEKGRTSATDGVPMALPAMALASKMMYRAEKFGISIPVEHSLELPAGCTEEQLGAALLGILDQARLQGLDAESALRSATKGYIAQIHAAEAPQPGAK